MRAAGFNYRLTRDREAFSLGGYGYSRSHHIAADLARFMGQPIHCQTIGESMGANGWIKP
jgi:hypothetical protein